MGSCITPFFKADIKSGQNIIAPCGKCPPCLKRRVSGWAFRLEQEERRSVSAKFVTLTYSTDHVPISRNGFMTLNKKHVQDFFKRLRDKYYQH